MTDKNSMLYWYPKIVDLPIPQPRTIGVEVNPDDAWGVVDDGKMYPQLGEFYAAVKLMGVPVFIRTDQLSGKHNWKNTCFVGSLDKGILENHIYALVEETLGCDIMGRPVNAFFFREYIEMDSKFTAFWGEMPVNSERRYFIEGGKVLCHHPYWIKESVVEPSAENWEELSEEMNTESVEEVKLLTSYAEMVANRFEGFWSVDFCRARSGVWYLIDMALGESSWHPKECPYNRTEEIDFLQAALDKYNKTKEEGK